MEDTSLSKLRFLVGGLVIVGALSLLPFLISVIWINPSVQAASSGPSKTMSSGLDESPNVITQGMIRAAGQFKQSTSSVAHAIDQSSRVVTKTVATASSASGRFVLHGVDKGVTTLASGAGSSLNFAVHTTGNVFDFIGNAPVVSSIIKPGDKDSIPVIDTKVKAAALAASASKKTAEAPVLSTSSAAVWPIHGEITTEFGVPHWPFQPIHTGLDISDGAAPGVSAVHAFKAGVVIAAIHSNEGFGNHVIVDHGSGLTSLYGHLASISVRVGQRVGTSTILGREGTTGASTGTHLHFEVRLNSQPVDPRKYIAGHP